MKTKEDFLSDPEFIRWVRVPDKDLEAYWQNYIKANPELLGQVKLAREILLCVRYEDVRPEEGLKEVILNHILREKNLSGTGRKKQVPGKIMPGNFWGEISQFYRVSAILLISFGLAWLAPPLDEAKEMPVAEKQLMLLKTTAAGEKLHITLPDGTKVWLNASSELEYPVQFDFKERRVALTGEGFFEVESDTLRPFRVVTEGLVTTALGTSFNVNTRTRDKISVALVTGKVGIKPSAVSEEVVLLPGQALHYQKTGQQQQVKGFDSREVLAWREGRFLFKDSSLKEVVDLLEDWYGVEIRLVNAGGADWRFSGEYQHQTLENVLKSMSYTQGFEYRIDGKQVEFKF